MLPKISIIVSNYNGAKLDILEDCLTSFKKIDYPSYEIILIDNASTDNSINIAIKVLGKNPLFRIIKNPVNIYSQGLNLGLNAAQGEYVAYFNNDVAIEKRYFHKLIEAFDKYPRLALAQGKLLWYFDHRIIDSAGETMDIYGNPVTLGNKSLDTHQFDKDEEILSASGSAGIIRKKFLKEVGVYAPDFGIGYEDMDLGLRIRQKGFSIMRIASAICYHKRGATDLAEMVRIKVRFNFNKNRLSTMIRNYSLFLFIKSLPVTILIYLGSFIWEVFTNKNLALALTRLQSILYVVLHLPQLLKERRNIRKDVTGKRDSEIIELFAKADIMGKIKAVILDKFQFSLPWTYPAEIKKLIPRNSTILDVGCGDGHLAHWINYEGEFKITGIDINKEELEIAKKRVTRHNKPIFENLLLVDITKKMPFKKKFDIVLCSQVVEHLNKDQALYLIQRIEKLAKKRIIIATINGFFQFNHKVAGKYDIHLSGWSPKDFSSRGYNVSGSGLRFIYKPGALKDITPDFLHPLLFFISYVATPLLRFIHQPALFQIAYKNTFRLEEADL